MAEKRTRRRFTAEFKAEAVKRLLDGGKGLGEVATELGAEPRPAERLAQRAPGGRLGGGAGRAQGRAGRAATAEAREQAARGGGRDPQEGRRFFRPGDRVSRFAFVAAERANHAVATLCRVVGASVVRLLRLAARDPFRPGPGRGGGRAARPDRPHLRRPSAGLRLAAGPRRAAPGGPAALAPARRAADARDGPAGAAGPPAAAADHRQPPRPAGRARTCSTATSTPSGPTRSGWPTSATCRRTRAGCTWPRSRTWPRARSSAGRWPTTCAPGCAWTRW